MEPKIKGAGAFKKILIISCIVTVILSVIVCFALLMSVKD